MAILQITGITRVEPTVTVDGSSRCLRFLVVAGSDSLTTKKYLVVLANLHLHIRHHRTYGTNLIAFVEEAGNGSRRFRQTIAHHHVYTYRMHKLADFIGHSSTCRRKEITVLNTYRLLQQSINGLFVELVFQMKHHRRSLSLAQIINVMRPAHLDGIQHHRFTQTGFLGNLLLHTGIDFLPKTGYTAHQCRAYLFNSSLDILWTEIDADLHPPVYTKVGPCLFEYMGQRKEVHGNIPVCHERQSDIMNAESLSIIEMMEHDTFRLTGSTGSIKDIGEVII